MTKEGKQEMFGNMEVWTKDGEIKRINHRITYREWKVDNDRKEPFVKGDDIRFAIPSACIRMMAYLNKDKEAAFNGGNILPSFCYLNRVISPNVSDVKHRLTYSEPC